MEVDESVGPIFADGAAGAVLNDELALLIDGPRAFIRLLVFIAGSVNWIRENELWHFLRWPYHPAY